MTAYKWTDEGQTAIEAVDGSVTIPADPANRHFAALIAEGVVIAPHVVPPPSLPDYKAALQSHIDGVAITHGYEGAADCVSYGASTNAEWAADAVAFVAWRDATWLAAHVILDAVTAGSRQPPTLDGMQAELPVIAWPGGIA